MAPNIARSRRIMRNSVRLLCSAIGSALRDRANQINQHFGSVVRVRNEQK